ncbi:zinc-ribbon domain-containing protein [Paenibacillus lignilyticus]|uniref:Zinc-ribbon domain-containing protein n=1 Tax=Paenibacillus lignilyticus TaxID=1172615 RepID=A0ABS5CK40_9BACL|nr:zinc-ribbon domain-containing protein [Paenibacillus lignilyticus]MBP3966245.1 zinc-ribbon domain-containing protein [Paenibacillus lignilyticus]
MNEKTKPKKLSDINKPFVGEWNFAKNYDLSPSDLTPQSNKKVWWLCSNGHEWEAIVQRRYLGDKCPYCSGKKATPETCLQTVNPQLALEWHKTKNFNLTPRDVLPKSYKRVWWECQHGHEWETRIDHRSSGSGCPFCKNKKKIKQVK